MTNAGDLARGLFARDGATDGSDDASALAAERIWAQIAGGLARWFGPYGSHALVARALARARAQHTVLALVTLTQESKLTGLADAARMHGGGAVVDAVVATIVVLGEQLGRMIGDDFALSLLEQSTSHSVTGNTAKALPATAGDPSEGSPEGGSTSVTS